jgi:acyl carrier protein
MTHVGNGIEREDVLREILAILEELTADWDMGFDGPMGPETRLVADLAFESIDVVQLIIAIEEHFQRRNLPFQKLLLAPDGGYVDDLRVAELVDFVSTWAAGAPAGA